MSSGPPRNGPEGTYRCTECDGRAYIEWEDAPQGSWLKWECGTCGETGREFHYWEEFSGISKAPETVQ